MEVNKENIRRAMLETVGQWEFYWKICKKNGGDTIIHPQNFEYSEGDMIFINLQVGYPHELAFGHYCYVLKDMGCKLLVIPATSSRGDRKIYEMDIINETGVSRLQFGDVRTVDKQRIDSRRDPIKVLTPKASIMREYIKILGGEI